jgi:hypothetical protein
MVSGSQLAAQAPFFIPASFSLENPTEGEKSG